MTVPKNTAVDFESMYLPRPVVDASRILIFQHENFANYPNKVAVANEKVTQTVTMNGKVISKQTDGKSEEEKIDESHTLIKVISS